MEISKSIRHIGANDHRIDLFESQFPVPHGMAYNSYVILDEKIAVMDTIEAHFGEEWMGNLLRELDGREPDYLVVHHMEPDHSANIFVFAERFPKAKIVASKAAFAMMKQFFGTDFPDRQIVVAQGSTLELGAHILHFVAAPMVHWPEVMMSYESEEKVLFSADAFGKFGANDVEEEWDCEARRYYFGIVGKYGMQVQAVLKKAALLDIQTICPLHGPVLKESIPHVLSLYDKWSSYAVESEGVVIAYTSVYGHTKAAVELLAECLRKEGCPKVAVFDLCRDDKSEAVEDAFRYGKLVLASTTYNTEVFPPMEAFLRALVERQYQKRAVAYIENGSWAPTAAKVMAGILAPCKEIEALATITVKGSMTPENEAEIASLAEKLAK